MTKIVACIPCSKRKVRCDRQEPCSHCRRRKKEDCIYPDASPSTRVKQLEALVRSLGHSPEGNGDVNMRTEASPSPVQSRAQPPAPHEQRKRRNSHLIGKVPNSDPVIVDEGGERVYLEASTWHSWDKRPRLSMNTPSSQRTTSMRARIPFQPSPGALQHIIRSDDRIDLASRHPTPDAATALWSAYYRNVNPLVKVAFKWELEQMRSTALSRLAFKELLPKEHALFFAIYLNSVSSLSPEQCLESFGQAKQPLLSEYRALFENALALADFLGRSEVILVQASILYISASLDEISTRSLGSFMGIVARHAERLGLHRDGTILNISPAETEKRRRIWWQLQHLDISLAVRSGSISLILMADWDVKLPLNIEDEDMSPTATEFPPERKGLTNMSFCLWTYYVLEKQRSFRRPDGSRVGGSWQADRSLSREQREEFVNELEEGVQTQFIRHCDPIEPINLLIFIFTRTFIWGMRRLVLHSDEMTRDGSELTANHEKDVLAACARCLEYDVYLHTQTSLERFYWRAKSFFPWHAFVYVISESARYWDGSEKTWDLLDRLYSSNLYLSNFTDDRRKPRAAEMILTAWQSYEHSYTECRSAKPQRPNFLAKLETLLAASKVTVFDTEGQPQFSGGSAANTLQNFSTEAEPGAMEAERFNADDLGLDSILDWDPNDIDWLFWSNWE